MIHQVYTDRGEHCESSSIGEGSRHANNQASQASHSWLGWAGPVYTDHKGPLAVGQKNPCMADGEEVLLHPVASPVSEHSIQPSRFSAQPSSHPGFKHLRSRNVAYTSGWRRTTHQFMAGCLITGPFRSECAEEASLEPSNGNTALAAAADPNRHLLSLGAMPLVPNFEPGARVTGTRLASRLRMGGSDETSHFGERLEC